MAATEERDKDLVLHLIAKAPTDFAAEIKTFRGLEQAPSSRIVIQDGPDSIKILDQSNTTTTDQDNSEATGQRGRACEIRASLKQGSLPKSGDIPFCKDLRNSEGFQNLQDKHDVQTIAQPMYIYHAHKTPGLIVFDMDSTLIQQEVIDELARKTGKGDECAAITERAMRGEIDFEESLRERVAFIAGVDRGIWQRLIDDVITITPGARDLIKALRGLGWKTAVASGGFMPLATWLKGELGMDYALANQLKTNGEDGALTGEILPGSKIVDGKAKRELLLDLAKQNNIPLINTIAVGDGSNDLLMMNAAGWGVAFNAKPKVQKEAPARLNSSSLLDIMYLLGFSREEIDEAIEKGETTK